MNKISSLIKTTKIKLPHTLKPNLATLYRTGSLSGKAGGVGGSRGSGGGPEIPCIVVDGGGTPGGSRRGVFSLVYKFYKRSFHIDISFESTCVYSI